MQNTQHSDLNLLSTPRKFITPILLVLYAKPSPLKHTFLIWAKYVVSLDKTVFHSIHEQAHQLVHIYLALSFGF